MPRHALSCVKCGVPVYDLPLHLAWHNNQEQRYLQLGLGLKRVLEQLSSISDALQRADQNVRT
jgi:hypothetical protein